MKTRTGIAVLLVVLLLVAGYHFIRFVLHTMEIDDRYGDLQDLYYQAENGDLILNRDFRQVGIIRKTGRFIYVIEDGKEVDLFDWVYPKEQETRVAVFRPEKKGRSGKGIGYNQLRQMIDSHRVKLVIEK